MIDMVHLFSYDAYEREMDEEGGGGGVISDLK